MTRARDLANLIGSGNFTTETLTATAGQTAFTPSNTFTSNFLQVFYNGLLLDPTVDYTENGTTITLTVAATAGDEMEVVTYNTFSVGDAITQTEADVRYVNAAGDTMTGALGVAGEASASIPNGCLIDQTAGYLTRILNYSSTTGSALALYTGPSGSSTERMRIDSAGRVTMPYQPAFNVSTSNTWTGPGTIPFNTANLNRGGHFNTSTYKFTAPIAGVYFFHYHNNHDTGNSGGSSALYADFYKNGAFINKNRMYTNFSGGWEELSGSITIELQVNDTMHVHLTSSHRADAGSYSCFCGYLIG